MADYSDDISKLLFDLDSQLEQTKRDIETSKKKSSEFEGFIEAFGSDGQSLSEKWEREEAEEKGARAAEEGKKGKGVNWTIPTTTKLCSVTKALSVLRNYIPDLKLLRRVFFFS